MAPRVVQGGPGTTAPHHHPTPTTPTSPQLSTVNCHRYQAKVRAEEARLAERRREQEEEDDEVRRRRGVCPWEGLGRVIGDFFRGGTRRLLAARTTSVAPPVPPCLLACLLLLVCCMVRAFTAASCRAVKTGWGAAGGGEGPLTACSLLLLRQDGEVAACPALALPCPALHCR